jgi:hypothetical protein
MRLGYALAGQTGLVRGVESLREGFDNFAKEAYGEKAIPTTKEFREAFEGVGGELAKTAQDLIKGTASIGDLQNVLNRSIEEGKVNLDVAGRMQNVVSAFQNMESGRDRFKKLGVVSSQEGEMSSFDSYTKQQRESGQTTVSGQVEVKGGINIKVDSPSNLTDQQVFNIFNNPEVQTQIFKIVKGMVNTEIQPLKK